MGRNFCALALAGVLLLAAAPAEAAPRQDAWGAELDVARTKMLDGAYRDAERDLRRLAVEAKTELDRSLASELADLAAAYAAQAERAPFHGPKKPERSQDEITLLYTSAFLYGMGTGVWFLLETSPDSALTATLPFAALTAAPVIAVATVDGLARFRSGVPHAISAGLYLGLGQGIWITALQHSRVAREREIDPATNARWSPEIVATVLWGGATLGATLGGAIGASVPTTPGRVSFTTSTTIWSGAIVGLAAGAILPDDASRQERAYVAAGAGYNAGLVSGLLLAGDVSPSVARVRIVDLLGAAGALATTGLYLSITESPELRLGEGLAAIGATTGLTVGWLATRGMAKELPNTSQKPAPAWRPTVGALRGGATLGLAGEL